MPTLAQQLVAIKAARATLATERIALMARLNAIIEEDLTLRGEEDALNAGMLTAVHTGLRDGKTLAQVGAELDAQVVDAVVDDPRL